MSDRYPRSSKYDLAWLLSLDMGPNPLWLLEDLARNLSFEPGMRVLDLGSGRGATSVFLAKEYGVDVVAADLWVDPAVAAATFAEAGVAERVEAVRAGTADSVITMLEADRGELLSFALVTAVK